MKISSSNNSQKSSKSDKKNDKTSQPPEAVKLPNLFGKKPIEYIIPLYSTILVLILLAIFVLPGLINPGTHYKFISSPNKSVVYLNDVYYGTSPLEVFVPAGSYKLSVSFGNHARTETTLESPWTVIGSLFAWFRRDLEVSLDISDSKQAILSEALSETGIWALDPHHDSTYQAPPALYDATKTVLFTKNKEQTNQGQQAKLDKKIAQSFSLAALASSSSRQQIRDAVRSSFLLAAGSPSPSPISIANSLRSFAKYADQIVLADGSLVDLELQRLVGSYQDNNGNPTRPSYQSLSLGNQLTIAGISFIQFGTGSKRYFLMKEELSRANYRQFLAENPEWQANNTTSLQEQNLVGKDYLADLTLTGSQGLSDLSRPANNGNSPVSGISYHAAQAYISWFNKTQLDPSLKAQGYRAQLPSAEQWLAARKAAQDKSGLGPTWFIKDAQRTQSEFSDSSIGLLQDMDGSLWEWTSSPYTPGLTLNGELEKQITKFDYELYQVLGGSWINRANEIVIDAPAGMISSSTFPYLGFRLAIVLAQGE